VQFSVDLLAVVINLIFLAFSYGKFAEKIESIEKRIVELTTQVAGMNNQYYCVKDGARLESSVQKLWEKMDKCPNCHKGM